MITSRHNDQISGQAIGRVFRQNLLTIATMGGVVAGSWWRLWCSSFSKSISQWEALWQVPDEDFMVIFLKINLTISCLSQEQSEQFSLTKIIFEWFKFLGNYIFMNWVVLNQYVLMNNDQKTYQELFWEWCWSRARRNSGRWGTQCKITKFVTFLSFLFVRGVSLDHFCLSSHICTC